MPDLIPNLAAYTTLRLGGPAADVVEATDEHQIIQMVRGGSGNFLVLAGGSNVVIGDDGFAGTVLLMRTRGRSVHLDGDHARLRVAAGEPWDDVVAHTLAEGWSGLECLSGIPGSAGATPIQNVGAYGQEVADLITSVRVLDRHTGEVLTRAPVECGFAYRTSVFKHSDRWIVLSVDFALTRSADSGPIRYAELAAALDVPVGAAAPVEAVRDAVLRLRAGKGMVLDGADPDTYSVGSFFTNPILTADAFAELTVVAGSIDSPPAWPGSDGAVKVSAAWLIERAGFAKGYRHDGVGISTKHTLALTNRGSGSTKQLLALAAEIRDGVLARFGVPLHPEPVLVNCSF